MKPPMLASLVALFFCTFCKTRTNSDVQLKPASANAPDTPGLSDGTGFYYGDEEHDPAYKQYKQMTKPTKKTKK